MTPQERDTILGIIERNIGRAPFNIDPALLNTGFEKVLYNATLEVVSYTRTMASAHQRETAVWMTRDDEVIRIVDIDDDHLLAIERAIAAGTAPATETDRANITAERTRRGLQPLKARKPIEAKISNILTEIHATYRTASANTRLHFLRGFATWLHEAASYMNESDHLEVNRAADVLSYVNPGDGQRPIVAIDPGSDGVAVVVDNKVVALCLVKDPNSEAVCMLDANHAGPHTGWPTFTCSHCKDTGSIDTGNNDLPCTHCYRGRDAIFNTMDGKQTGAQQTRESEWPETWGVKPSTLAAVRSLADRRSEIREMLKRGEITQDEAHAEFPESF